MTSVSFREPGEPLEYGYDWVWAPSFPDDRDCRKAWDETQMQWLQTWKPRPESVQ